MILQELYQLAERENLMEEPDYESKPVSFLVRVSREGKITGIEDTRAYPTTEHIEAKKRVKAKPIAKSYRLPREKAMVSDADRRAFLLYGKAEHVFGIDPDGYRELGKLAARSKVFRRRVKECLDATQDEGVAAVLQALISFDAKKDIQLPERLATNDLFTFVYEPDIDVLVVHRPKVHEYWKSSREAAVDRGGNRHTCLVSGEEFFGEVMNFPGVKRVPGGTTSGVALVSFNKNAFESYGWKGNQNAPISRTSAEAASEALKRLLDPTYPDPYQPGQTLPKRNIRISDDTAVCYWSASKSGEVLCNAFSGLLDANPEEVSELYKSAWRGVPVVINDDSAFFALVISGAQGRAIARDWIESTIAKTGANLANHFRDLEIVRNAPAPKESGHRPTFGIRLLLESLAPDGDRKGIPPPLVGQMLNAAIKGTPYPISILEKALERERAEAGKHEWLDENRRDARTALIKAYLNRNKRFHPTTSNYQEVKREMDPGSQSQGYVLGQMMAVLERTQQAALGNVGSTLIDRYFASASASPRTVFPRLMKNARNHMSKAKDGENAGLAFRLDKILDELSSKIGAAKNQGYNIMEYARSFPAYLPLEEQGLFVLGYHHMRKWLWLSKEERERWLRENPAAPSSFIWS